MQPSAARVATMFLTAGSTVVRLTGTDREPHADDVWDMYTNLYRSIGMSIKSARGLLEYPVWDIAINGEESVAFMLYKTKRYGLKSGLSGHNGSPAGKAAALQGIRTKFLRPGIYGEVSHKVKAIALSAGAPVVCAAYASQVLGKPTDLDEDDPLSYTRSLKGVGKVTKTLVGNPRGIPTTDARNPECPVVAPYATPPVTEMPQPHLAAEIEAAEIEDLDAHHADTVLTASLGL